MAQSFATARFLTVQEVADIMRVSTMTVYRIIKSGELPAVRVGRSFRVRDVDVDTYLGTALHASRLSGAATIGRRPLGAAASHVGCP